MPSDGGRYSCMAVGISGNASRDVVIQSKVPTSLRHVSLSVINVSLVDIFSVFSCPPACPPAQPGPPHYLTVTPGPTSVLFTLKTFPINGGAPIKSFVLQWRKSATEKWEETIVATSGENLYFYSGFVVVIHVSPVVI